MKNVIASVLNRRLTTILIIICIMSIISFNGIAEEPIKAWEVVAREKVRAIAWSPSGKYIAVGGINYIALYKFKSNKPLWERFDKGYIWSIAWSPDESKILTFSFTDKHIAIRIYSNTSKLLWEDKIDISEVYTGLGIKWKADRKKLHVALCGPDGIFVYKLVGKALIELWKEKCECEAACSIHPNAKVLATVIKESDGRRRLYFYDISDGTVLHVSSEGLPIETVFELEYSFSGKYVALVGKTSEGEGVLQVYSSEGELLDEAKLKSLPYYVQWATDDYVIVCLTKEIYIFYWHDNKLSPVYGFKTEVANCIWDIDLSPDGRYLTIAADEKKLIFYDISELVTLTTPPGLDIDIVVTMTTTTTETVTKTITKTITPSTTTITRTITTTETKTKTKPQVITMTTTVTTTIPETKTTTITITETKGLSIETALLIVIIVGIIAYAIGRKS